MKGGGKAVQDPNSAELTTLCAIICDLLWVGYVTVEEGALRERKQRTGDRHSPKGKSFEEGKLKIK